MGQKPRIFWFSRSFLGLFRQKTKVSLVFYRCFFFLDFTKGFWAFLDFFLKMFKMFSWVLLNVFHGFLGVFCVF